MLILFRDRILHLWIGNKFIVWIHIYFFIVQSRQMDYNWNEITINLMPVLKSMFQPNPISWFDSSSKDELFSLWLLSLQFFSFRIVFTCVWVDVEDWRHIIISNESESMICYGLEISTDSMRSYIFFFSSFISSFYKERTIPNVIDIWGVSGNDEHWASSTGVNIVGYWFRTESPTKQI